MAYKQTKFAKSLLDKASKLNKTIVLPEAEYSPRVLQAGLYCAKHGIANVVLVAKSDKLAKYDNGTTIKVVNITSSDLSEMLASALYVKRKEKGVTLEDATKLVQNELYFGTMMVELGLVDGMVAGAENTTQDVFRPALQIIKTKPGQSIASSVIFLTKGSDTYAFADCSLNINPDAEQLACITKQTALSVKKYTDFDPIVALLSYSTNGSGKGESVDKVRDCVQLLRSEKCDFAYDGEMQVDCALDEFTRKLKYKDCKLKANANTFVFPNLDSSNIGYKLLTKIAGYTAVGPLSQGLNKPVNDISRGATTQEIVLIIASTAIEGE